MSGRPYTRTKPGWREHSKQRDGTRSTPIVIAKTQGPYQNKGEQIVPLYPESFAPSSGAWLSQSPADRAPSPSSASALVLYLLSRTSILPHRFSGQIERGEKTNHSSTYSRCSLSCQHFSQTSPPPSHIDTEKWLPFALWLPCFILSAWLFLSPRSSNQTALPGQQSHCLFKWKRQWISESLSIFPLY